MSGTSDKELTFFQKVEWYLYHKFGAVSNFLWKNHVRNKRVEVTKARFLKKMGKPLNLDDPQDFNEKVEWLKLNTYYKNPVVTTCADKYRVRKYLEDKGFGYLLPKFIDGGFTDPKLLVKHWDEYPDSFVVKCNHGCAYNILIPNKADVDPNEVAAKIKKFIREDYWVQRCETQYMMIKKAILVEQYLGHKIKTYHFYCFHGEPKIVYVSTDGDDGKKDLYMDYFDMDWNWLEIIRTGHLQKKDIPKPQNYEKMVEIAKELSKDFPFVRVDLYNVDGKIYFSELTFIPTGGMMEVEDDSVLYEWGKWLKLPCEK